MQRSSLTRLTACAAAGVLVVQAAGTAMAVPAATKSASAPTISWENCEGIDWFDDFPHIPDDVKQRVVGTECGQMQAPLDYTQPDGEHITIRMSRMPAKHQAEKRGTVFMNPGGPGGTAVLSTAKIAQDLGPEVTDYYDVIGIDPRGVLFTERLDCGPIPPNSEPIVPWRPDQVMGGFQSIRDVHKACHQKNPRIARFMTTADLARDLDRARVAVDEDKMTFYGVSYGTMVASTYANMFPDKVRAIVADSAIDPVAYSTGYGRDSLRTPAFARLQGVAGAARAKEAAITDCEQAGPDVCVVAETIRDDWEYVANRLPGRSVNYFGFELSYQNWVVATVSYSYKAENVARGVYLTSAIANLLRQQEASGPQPFSTAQAALPPALAEVFKTAAKTSFHAFPALTDGAVNLLQTAGAAPVQPSLPTRMQRFLGVMCSETQNPADLTQVPQAATRADHVMPGVGTFRTWQSAGCVHWPFRGKNAYTGPYNKKLANPMLVLGVEHDAATPLIEGTQRLHAMSPDSRLVTVPGGYTHSAVETSRCAQQVTATYLTTGHLPEQNVTCTPDRTLADEFRTLNNPGK